MEQNVIGSMYKSMADRGLSKQKVNTSDYYENGLLMCGLCHTNKQILVKPPKEIGLKEFVASVDCECEQKKKQRIKEEEEREKREKRIRELKQDGLDKIAQESTFDKFLKTQENSRNFKISQRYVDKFEELRKENQGLIFWGPVGTGKSFLAACIANKLIENGYVVIMTSFIQVINTLRTDSDSADELLRKIRTAHLVIFDDFGTERCTDFALETIYSLIDYRYRNKRPIILTTNMTYTQLQEEKDSRYMRIYDRVCAICYPLEFTGSSWRRAMTKDKYQDTEKSLLEQGEGNSQCAG